MKEFEFHYKCDDYYINMMFLIEFEYFFFFFFLFIHQAQQQQQMMKKLKKRKNVRFNLVVTDGISMNFVTLCNENLNF